MGLAGATAAVNTTYEATDQWETLLNTVTATKELVTASQPSGLNGSQSLKYIATVAAGLTAGEGSQIVVGDASATIDFIAQL